MFAVAIIRWHRRSTTTFLRSSRNITTQAVSYSTVEVLPGEVLGVQDGTKTILTKRGRLPPLHSSFKAESRLGWPNTEMKTVSWIGTDSWQKVFRYLRGLWL